MEEENFDEENCEKEKVSKEKSKKTWEIPKTFSKSQKDKVVDKLNHIYITDEKKIINMKVSELRKINDSNEVENLSLKDIYIIWLMQDAIKASKLYQFFADNGKRREV